MPVNAFSPDPAPFADARALLSRALPAFLPPERMTVAQHAAKKRWLNNQGGGFVGRWSHDEAPYLVEPMEALTSDDHLTVAVAGPGRSGKTAIAENWIGYAVDVDPADTLWYEPTDDVVEAYVKSVINDMIVDHPHLRQNLGPLPIDRSIHFKRFVTGMHIEFLPMAENNLRNKSAPRLVLDEIDAAPDSLGDVYGQADLRRQTFGRGSTVLAISHPDQALGLEPARWTRGIMRLYAQSTRCTWWWPCPECGDYSSPNPTAARVMALHYPEDAPLDEIRDAAALLCPSCGGLIADRHRRAMNLHGKWAGLGQVVLPDGTIEGERRRNDIAGYWIVGAMSPFIIGGLGALAAAKVAAERDRLVSGDDKPLRTVMARRFGVPYEPPKRTGEVDAATLADRAEDHPLGMVPQGVRFLTCMVDVQANRFEVMVRGWGIDGENWVIDVRRVVADTGVSPGAWDDLLTGLLRAEFPLADGSGRGMRLRALGYDSGGSPGVTQQAYAAWRRLRIRRESRFLGRIDGRDVFNVMPMKGASGPNAPRCQVVYPTSKRRDRDARATGAEPLLLFNPNAFKDDLGGQLACGEPGPWYVHHPRALRGEYPPPAEPKPETPDTRHEWFEQVVAERQDARGRWVKTRDNAPNEALDQHVGCHVLAELHGLARMRWVTPQPWAAEWDRNVLVGPLTGPVRAAPATGGTDMAPPPAPPRPAVAGHVTAAARIASMARRLAG